MTPEEIGDVLALAAARDRRTVGEADIFAWLDDLAGITFDEAREAIRRHYRKTDDWLTAFDVRDEVRQIRNDRRRDARRGQPSLTSAKFRDDPAQAECNATGRARCDAAAAANRAARLAREARTEPADQADITEGELAA